MSNEIPFSQVIAWGHIGTDGVIMQDTGSLGVFLETLFAQPEPVEGRSATIAQREAEALPVLVELHTHASAALRTLDQGDLADLWTLPGVIAWGDMLPLIDRAAGLAAELMVPRQHDRAGLPEFGASTVLHTWITTANAGLFYVDYRSDDPLSTLAVRAEHATRLLSWIERGGFADLATEQS